VLIIIAAVAVFWCFAGLLVTRELDARNSRNLRSQNRPELLLGSPVSETARKLPEITGWNTNLTPTDLAFGREHVARMVKDRPHMADSVYESDAIYQFCVRGFAGAATGEPIVWDSTIPEDKECHAEHLRPCEGKRGFIRVRNDYGAGALRGSPLSCQEMWACVVFELENIRSWRADDELYRLALAGGLTREEWIRECSKLEYGALRRTAADWKLVWAPLARTRHLRTTASFWGLNVPPTYEAWITAYTDPSSYPWNPFGRYYDDQVIPYLRGAGIRPKDGR
jgi:hypothetical protein